LGFGGASPVIQIAGAQKALTREPRAILDDGDYDTNVTKKIIYFFYFHFHLLNFVFQLKIMFGANKHEGIEMLIIFYYYKLVISSYIM